MLKSISWGQYSLVLLVLLVLYYGYLGVAYYRVELLALLKGKATPTGLTPSPERQLAPLIGRGPLIARPAVAPIPSASAPTPPTSTPAPPIMAAQEPTQMLVEVDELPALDFPKAEIIVNFNDENYSISSVSDSNDINFTEQSNRNLPSVSANEVEAKLVEAEPDFSVGVAQLGSYLNRAEKGELTPAQVVEQVPALENTDLLVAFFQASSKGAQRATAHLYAGVNEPAAD